ncbi:MAG: hydroxymethylbilane synthase [Rickettsiales bacterium]
MIRIGTRSSRLAVFQAELLKYRLVRECNVPESEVVIKRITTTGDKIKDKNLYQIGGKGLFIKELEESLLSNNIDIAVHSLKDIPAITPESLKIAAVIDKGNPYDAFLSNKSKDIFSLPQNATLGTSSPRRAAQIKSLRPDIKIVSFRGNVDTRINKLNSNLVDATILSVAGLERLEVSENYYSVIDCSVMIPAIGQGVICAECRDADSKIYKLLNKVNDSQAYKLAVTERIVLEGMGADCKTPIAGYAWIENDKIHLKSMVAKYDGSQVVKVQVSGKVDDYESVGREALNKLQSMIGRNFFSEE